MRGKSEWKVEGKQDWAEIEALINGSPVPKFNDNDKNNQINPTDKNQLLQYFRKNNIKEVKFENGKLIITYNNNNNNETKTFRQISHDPEYLKIMEYCQKVDGNKITQEDLNLSSSNSSTNPKNSQWENKYLWLVGGILFGVIISLILYFGNQRKKRK